MVNFAELYCAHVEQIGVRYPDAWHVGHASEVTPFQIKSNIFFGDEAVVFTSDLDVDGSIQHYVEPYTPWANKKARANGLRTH